MIWKPPLTSSSAATQTLWSCLEILSVTGNCRQLKVSRYVVETASYLCVHNVRYSTGEGSRVSLRKV